MLRVLDLFSGIGGFSLGLERTGGFRTVQFVEIGRYQQQVLQKRWPGVPIHDDIRTFRADPVGFDVVCGGFPCQDISIAGKGQGISGSQSGLWKEMHRIIDEARPQWVVAENVPSLRSRGLDQVLGSLSEIGYDAEWHCVPAAAVGARHRRDRIWILAYPNDAGRGEQRRTGPVWSEISPAQRCGPYESLPHSGCLSPQVPTERLFPAIEEPERAGLWETEPGVGRVAHGIPSRMDRLKCLGNAIVPQIAEQIGKAILKRG